MVLRSKPLPFLLNFITLIVLLACSGAVVKPSLLAAQTASSRTHPQQDAAAPNTSYVDEPPDQLLRTIPELKTLQPARDQTQLANILEHTARNLDAQFANFSDLVAKEIVSETRVNPTTDLWGQPLTHPNEPNLMQNQYSYFIVREGTLVQTRIREYRRDRYGTDGSKPVTSPLLATPTGITFLSADFASSLLYFSSDLQKQERFRYLGQQHVGQRTTYVVAFAQVPGAASVALPIRMPNREQSNWLLHGIAWIDASTFDILQMRTDLLARYNLLPPCGRTKDQLQTVIQFSPVQPQGVPNTMWLPTEADVHETLGDCKNPVQIARNEHHFSEYRLYNGAANLATPKETTAEIVHARELTAHPYLELSLAQLAKRIPQLKGISPAPDQQALPPILQQAGKQVDGFFSNLVDLIAHEDITQQRLATGTLAGGMPAGTMQAQERTHDNYLILRRNANGHPRIEEFRMDAKGNRLDETGLTNGFFITSGFALSSIHLATKFQWDSRFLYLGTQRIAGHDTYVLAFAQLPSEAQVAVTMRGGDGSTLRLLTQGIAWVDKTTFHIRQLRTDLLSSQPEIGLAEQTTTIIYSEVRFADLAAPLWLPHDVDVFIKFTDLPPGAASDFAPRVMDQTFRNIHHYSNYLLYRVSTKMVAPH